MQLDVAELSAALAEYDPEQGDLVTPPKYWAGIDDLLQAFGEVSGVDPQRQKGDLLGGWQRRLARKPGERVIDFCTRFRNCFAEMQASASVTTWRIGIFVTSLA